VTGDSGIVTADSGNPAKIGHDKTKSPVTFVRNGRSRSNEMTGHDGPKYALEGAVMDQTELIGVLNNLYEMHLPRVSVTLLD